MIPPWVHEHYVVLRSKGRDCPTCGQFAKVYHRKLNATMAAGLVALYRETARAEWGGRSTWVRMAPFLVHSIRSGSGDYAKLRWWRLIETRSKTERESSANRTACLWRITPEGRAFVEGLIKVPSHALIYNDECIDLDGPPITIREALGSRFDYEELMRS